ncbi:MAG TPA: hypothetical protein VGW14_08685 [Thermoleophilaceae bacterium]|nr:hypothetical protein [Thermoleophilaceae bacterium]
MLAGVCLLLGPASALAQDPPAEVPDIAVSEAQPVTSGPSYGIATASGAPRLWATVNICDTAAAPDSMGVRAAMPGNTSRQRMFMRFRAEYWSRSLQDWASVAGSGISPWVYAGPARYERRQAGWTFEFAAPPAGVTFTMRALVEFEWRRPKPTHDAGRKGRHSRVVRTVSRATETGIRGVDGGDPAGTSKAMCLIY